MRSDPFEREMAERLRGAPPPQGLEDRLAQRARAQVAGGRCNRRRARAAVLAIAALSAVGAGAAGAVVLLRGDGPAAPAGPAARAAIAESGVLGRAPWLFQAATGSALVQEADALPALSFPAGTTYAEAVRALLASVVSSGALPPEAALVPALPRDVVWSPPGEAGRPRLSLVAPWGYTIPAGRIRAPVLRLGSATTAAEARGILAAIQEGRATGRPLPAQVEVGAPALAPCQVADPGVPRGPCALAPPGRDG